jgi:hypothetical protein
MVDSDGVEDNYVLHPGTEEHRVREATHPTGHGLSSHDYRAGTVGTVYDRSGTNVGATGSTTYNTAASAEQKSVGQKIKEHIPGKCGGVGK